MRSVEPVTRALKDGRPLLIRGVIADDKEMLRDAFHRVSAQTRMLRFLRDIPEPSEAMLEYLTDVDQSDHVAIWAILESPDLKSEVAVGIARCLRLDGEPAVAESAVTVTDDMQRQGVGRALLERLVELASERGIERFRSEVLTTNEPVRRILEASGAQIVSEGEGSVLFEAEIAPKPQHAGIIGMLRDIAKHWR